MTLRQRAEAFIKDRVVERPAQKLGLAGLRSKLAAEDTKLQTRFAEAGGSEAHRKTLRHIIAIERWGQTRLRSALGEPLRDDTNHDYKPDGAVPWAGLQGQFAETRAQTLQLVQQLVDAHIDPTKTVPHNQFGLLSVAGWLRYLNFHASVEAKRIR